MQCAAHWLSVLSDESCTEAERQQFFAWLRASGQNVDEFLKVSHLDAHLNRRELWPNESVADLVAAAKASGASNVATLGLPENVGALAFKRTGEPSMGNFGEATILKTFGSVPENLDEL